MSFLVFYRPVLCGIIVICVFLVAPGVSGLGLHAFCEQHVYLKHSRPQFPSKPRPYILPYYKRCVNHDEWEFCVGKFRKKKMHDVVVRKYEENFPPNVKDMGAAGTLLCYFTLSRLDPNIAGCTVDRDLCDRAPTSNDSCEASVERVRCLTNEFRKCKGVFRDLMQYESRLLGDDCFQLQSSDIQLLTVEEMCGVATIFPNHQPLRLLMVSIFYATVSVGIVCFSLGRLGLVTM